MTWPCKLIEKPELTKDGHIDMSKRAVGDMWFLDVPEADLREHHHLTDYYWANNAHRKPLVVLLPYKTHPEHPVYFLLDGKCYSEARGYYDAWTVTGEPPLITVSPSIDMKGAYHGFLQNGVIGDPL